jgi:hypothetical protein
MRFLNRSYNRRSTKLLRWVELFTYKLEGMLSSITIILRRVLVDDSRIWLSQQLMTANNLPIKLRLNKLIRPR